MDLPWGIVPNQHVTVYEKTKGCVDKGRIMDIEYPDFRKAFDTVVVYPTRQQNSTQLLAHSPPLRWDGGENLKSNIQIHLSHFNLSSLIHLLLRSKFLSGPTLGYLEYSGPQILCIPDSKTLRVDLESPLVFSARGSRECFDCVELGNYDNKIKCLWVRMRGKANKADIILGVCYRPPNQDEEADEAFYEQLAGVSQSLALVLVGNFNLPDICWKYNAAERKQSRRLLECVEENFLTQLVIAYQPTRGGALLDLLFTKREGLVGDVGGWRPSWA
ncbi:hypothetical protein QYF61_022796 [Mycteria americana]|uniref:Endonuclease/exonuclease/phosphatase domain-containing protein n=1 Tax=Mycteria americana TaxID=33587 RepID=A0AAN7S0U5_MYCAM|nr:hypothetical protein QYF61_022796 [Mycteria americana]